MERLPAISFIYFFSWPKNCYQTATNYRLLEPDTALAEKAHVLLSGLGMRSAGVAGGGLSREAATLDRFFRICPRT